MKDDTISRQAASDTLGNIDCSDGVGFSALKYDAINDAVTAIKALLPAQQTALTADDIETIRIHLSAFKEELCNQSRWTEAAEYERLIQRLTGKGGTG